MRILLLLLLFAALSLQAQVTETRVSIQMDSVSLRLFVEEVSRQTGLKIWVRDDWADGIKISLHADQVTVDDAFRQALQGTGLTVSAWNNDLVVLEGDKLITELPGFEQKKQTADSSATSQKNLTETEQRYLTGRKSMSAPVFTIGTKGGRINGSKARIQGDLEDSETGEPLFNATLYIDETQSGAISDINGIMSIMLKPGKYNGIIEILGYEKLKIVLNVLSDGYFKIALNKAVIDIKEFVVYGDRQMNVKSKDPGIEKITMKAVKELPMMMGERDIIKISGMLPGIVNAGEGSAGLNVRGGSFDQNAFYINKVPVYNTSHLFGFFPAFNSDIIKDFSIFKGHIPASFGGRLSSVFNVVTRQGNRKRFTARGGLSPVTGNIVVEGPILKDKASVLLSARSSYSDWILNRIKDPEIRASSTNFSDFSGSVGVELNKTHISLFGYHSSDKFRLAGISDYNYSNDGASLIVANSFSQALRAEFSVVAASYHFATAEKAQETAAYEHAYNLDHYEVKAQFQHLLSDIHSLEYGAGMTLYKLNRGTVKPYGTGSLLIPVQLGNEKGTETFVYLSDSWEANSWLNIVTGIRYATFTPLGPDKVLTYFPGSPIDLRNVSDTLEFRNNQFIRWYNQPDLRLAVNIETDGNGTVKLAFNRTHQNLFMLNSNITIAPNTQWKLADYHLKPSESNQLSAGIFRSVSKPALETSVEAFYKQSKNYPEFRDGANFLDTPQTETATIQGKQHSYGLEFMIKRSNQKLDGWLSYTWSRSFIKVNGENEWDRINNGMEYPSNFDIPHAVNLVANYHLSRRITFATVIVYQTGRPVTYPVSIYYIDGVPYLDYSSRNAYRIPDYFRTDLSMTIEGNLRKNKLLHSSLSISVYNLTGRDNPASVYFVNEKGRIKSYQYSVIGVPILTATWMFKLGNYASD
ncbi:MAG: carboxypeptidase-like regulatory domain-containing protein [Chloroflexota bacterium]